MDSNNCDNVMIYYSLLDRTTGKPYRDPQTNVLLPGVWKGACNAPIGPDPNDNHDWKRCCQDLRERPNPRYRPTP